MFLNFNLKATVNAFRAHQGCVYTSFVVRKKSLRTQRIKRQPHKIVKHTLTIHRQIADELFECVGPFCGVGA